MTIPTDELTSNNQGGNIVSANNQPESGHDNILASEEEEIIIVVGDILANNQPKSGYDDILANDEGEIIIVDMTTKPDETNLAGDESLPRAIAVPVYNDVLHDTAVCKDVLPEAPHITKKKSKNPYKRYRSVRRLTKGTKKAAKLSVSALGKAAVATGYVVYYGGEIMLYTVLIVAEVAGSCS